MPHNQMLCELVMDSIDYEENPDIGYYHQCGIIFKTLTCDCNNLSMILFNILDIIFCMTLTIFSIIKNRKTKQNSNNVLKKTKQV